MKLFTLSLAVATAVTFAAPAFATYQEPIPVPEVDIGGGDDTAAIIMLLGIGAFILWQSMRDDTPEDLSTPRPTVRPDLCFDKNGGATPCQ